MNTLQILSVGAGAIGTYIGGSLALKGHTVVFVERPATVAELEKRGLRLTLGEQEHTLPNSKVLPSIEAALDLGKFDVALFALKSASWANQPEQDGPSVSETGRKLGL